MAVRFVGGPCNGKTVAQAWYGTINCGGMKYTLEEDGNYHAVTAPRVTTKPKAAISAWQAMNRALGADTQRMISRLHHAERRISRETR